MMQRQALLVLTVLGVVACGGRTPIEGPNDSWGEQDDQGGSDLDGAGGRAGGSGGAGNPQARGGSGPIAGYVESGGGQPGWWEAGGGRYVNAGGFHPWWGTGGAAGRHLGSGGYSAGAGHAMGGWPWPGTGGWPWANAGGWPWPGTGGWPWANAGGWPWPGAGGRPWNAGGSGPALGGQPWVNAGGDSGGHYGAGGRRVRNRGGSEGTGGYQVAQPGWGLIDVLPEVSATKECLTCVRGHCTSAQKCADDSTCAQEISSLVGGCETVGRRRPSDTTTACLMSCVSADPMAVLPGIDGARCIYETCAGPCL